MCTGFAFDVYCDFEHLIVNIHDGIFLLYQQIRKIKDLFTFSCLEIAPLKIPPITGFV
jgi:hypothetical protein